MLRGPLTRHCAPTSPRKRGEVNPRLHFREKNNRANISEFRHWVSARSSIAPSGFHGCSDPIANLGLAQGSPIANHGRGPRLEAVADAIGARMALGGLEKSGSIALPDRI